MKKILKNKLEKVGECGLILSSRLFLRESFILILFYHYLQEENVALKKAAFSAFSSFKFLFFTFVWP